MNICSKVRFSGRWAASRVGTSASYEWAVQSQLGITEYHITLFFFFCDDSVMIGIEMSSVLIFWPTLMMTLLY